jgi:glutamyl/glutaminyl-tRNA synthetase
VDHGRAALTRIAPTPSGFLHAGNRLNFTLISDLARRWRAIVALRIDDADGPRYRREYVEDIFLTLHELGIEWQVGPRDVDDFESHWSQRAKTEKYRAELHRAIERGLAVYACMCSRQAQRGPASGGCVGGCRSRSLSLAPGDTSLRAIVDQGSRVAVGNAVVPLDLEMGDPVIWRRDDVPSYHLVSILEDRDLGVTHVVRGADLLGSTALQIHLARWFDAANVEQATYVHHDLILDRTGAKLSKSTLAPSREECR